MPAPYVNLPLASIAQGAPYLDLFLEEGLSAELGIDAFALNELSPRWHAETARRLAASGMRVAAHLPFMELRPGTSDPGLLAATRDLLARGMDLAEQYGAAHMVGHVCFIPDQDGTRAEDWLRITAETWNGLLGTRPGAPLLCLENTWETDYQPLLDLVSRLPEGRAGLCLDLGHWHCYAGGVVRRDLTDWVGALGQRLKHLHLHDNDGSGDQHLGLGRGAIPFAELFAALAAHGLTPSMTLEPHTREDYEQSARFMAGHPQWFPMEDQ